MGVYEVIFRIGGYLCHQKPERSFFIGKYQLPICARCFGILIGGLLGFIFALLLRLDKFYLIAFLCLPMIADGLLQGFTSYLSNNRRRLITGILFGFGFSYAYILTYDLLFYKHFTLF